MKKTLVLLLAFIAIISCTKFNFPEDSNRNIQRITGFSWTPMKQNRLVPRRNLSGTWTGSQWILWGGYTGGSDPEGRGQDKRALFGDGAILDPATNEWMEMSSENAPSARFSHTAVWTGDSVIVWGGAQANPLNTGGIYHVASNQWKRMSVPENFPARMYHSAIWTGEKMFLWGGTGGRGRELSQGYEYDPSTDTWQQLPTEGEPAARYGHTAVFAANKIYIWGGQTSSNPGSELADGWIYDVAKKEWSQWPGSDFLSRRAGQSAVLGRRKIFFWGGSGPGPDGGPTLHQDGAYYDLRTGEWKHITGVGAPSPRRGHHAVWTGKKLMVWGGIGWASAPGESPAKNDGGLYDPKKDTWEPLLGSPGSFSKRFASAGVWTGDAFLVWGGVSNIRSTGNSELADGAHLVFPTSELEDE